jgi:hypothetical protein
MIVNTEKVKYMISTAKKHPKMVIVAPFKWSRGGNIFSDVCKAISRMNTNRHVSAIVINPENIETFWIGINAKCSSSYEALSKFAFLFYRENINDRSWLVYSNEVPVDAALIVSSPNGVYDTDYPEYDDAAMIIGIT